MYPDNPLILRPVSFRPVLSNPTPAGTLRVNPAQSVV